MTFAEKIHTIYELSLLLGDEYKVSAREDKIDLRVIDPFAAQLCAHELKLGHGPMEIELARWSINNADSHWLGVQDLVPRAEKLADDMLHRIKAHIKDINAFAEKRLGDVK